MYNSKKNNNQDTEIVKSFLELNSLVIKILNKLRVGVTRAEALNINPTNKDGESINLAQLETSFAHYTRPSTAYAMLSEEKVLNKETCSLEKKDPSNFRLSTLEFVNDPTEGDLLFDYLSRGKLNFQKNEESEAAREN